ncbi:response regulator [Tolumonas lignilytica]|uniref:response regulator n=1 Tax=Tolumonas lignilytica TaxID=1283284 RepID=UPI000463825D|nr:response regulator [Tolumonas lignilytica]
MPLNVLICDDSAFARKQLARALPTDWNVNVHFAGDGQEGLEQILSGHGDLVFLDLTMPVMDGYQVLQALLHESLKTKVIVVSGDIQPAAHAQVTAMGALAFIKKPCSSEEIVALLTELNLYQPGGEPSEVAEQTLNLSVEVRDVYQEIANVAMGQAADLLARMLGQFVILPIPNVNVLEVGELHMALNSASGESTLSAVCQGFIGAGIAGEALVLFHDSSFADLAKLMKYQGIMDRNAELELLMDMSNVLIGAFLRGFAMQLDVPFNQGHPVVLGQHRPVEDLIKANQHRWRRTLAIEINYKIRDHQVQCDLLLLFTEDSLQYMNHKIMHLL